MKPGSTIDGAVEEGASTGDPDGRLTTACAASSCAGTPAKLESTYDAEGHRIRLVETTAGASPTVTTTDLTYEGNEVVRETQVSGTTTVT